MIMDGQSLTPDITKLQQLKELLPETFSKCKIDWEKQKAALKFLKLSDSNVKQLQQIKGKYANAIEERMKSFIDPVAENVTIENMVYELLLKNGKDQNNPIKWISTGSTTQINNYKVNNNELIFMLEKASQNIVDSVLKEKLLKIVVLDKLFKGNEQFKTNTVLSMNNAGVEFKTI